VLYGHILPLEKSDPLQMATIDDNLNQPCPPGNSKREANHAHSGFKRLGYSKDRVLRLHREFEDQYKKLHKTAICGGKICMTN